MTSESKGNGIALKVLMIWINFASTEISYTKIKVWIRRQNKKKEISLFNWKLYQFYSGISANIQFLQDYYGCNYRLWKAKRDFFTWSVNQQLQQMHPFLVIFPMAKFRTVFSTMLRYFHFWKYIIKVQYKSVIWGQLKLVSAHPPWKLSYCKIGGMINSEGTSH